MYCPKCGKENPEDARFCMHCGADLSGYKVEVAPKIEVSPKISVSAKAEGGVALKWKQKPIKYAEIKGYGKLPVFGEHDLVKLEDKPFCPVCGNYACLEKLKDIEGICKVSEKGEEREVYATYALYHCLACDNRFLKGWNEVINSTKIAKYVIYDGDKIPVYKNVICRLYTHDTSERFLYISIGERGEPMKLEKSSSDGRWRLFTHGNLCDVALCPICKRKDVKPIITHYQVPGDPYYADWSEIRSTIVVERCASGVIIYSLWKCKTCGKFLVYHGEKKEEEYYKDKPQAYPLCEFCEDAAGIYTCPICGKRICENCSIKVKIGFLSKEIRCPNCAKKK